MLANFIYLTGLILISPIVLWRCLHGGRYRRGVSEKLLGLSKKKARQLFPAGDDPSDPLMQKNRRWFHAVSVGEVNLLPGLIKRLEKEDSIPFVVSASTDTGYDLAVKLFGADRVFFCPLDFTWSVRRTLRNLRVNELILVELELWPNLIRFANQN
ncbi:MAG: glycosyltransferase N-terminal domain-containing protein, partial [Planctomycetota bacterium]|nr:glycosyltransferase N-terminal domain-containing protein [Planctomycetota bacterium]